jgi:dihydroorotate dehydrogenase
VTVGDPREDRHRVYGLVRRLFFVVPPERIHTLVFAVLRGVTAVAFLRWLLHRLLGPTDPVLASTVFGVRFPGPLGLAAGFDKDGTGLSVWGAMGFGYAEIGTVTAHPQPGNPAPRMFRLPADRALLNRMGFNNNGAGALAIRLARHRPEVPIGVNIGKTKTTPAGCAVDDYRASARLVAPLASYLVVNVSSPNTPGLRDLQAVESLRPILSAVLTEASATSTPVLVKIAPDISDSDIDDIADLAVELGLAGIVATNTTVSRDGLITPAVNELGAGGISGPPVARRAAEVLRRLYGRVGHRLALISVGGIETADDAWDRITAGASLLQGYTGFIYGGGLWAKHIHDGIARRLHDGGFASLSDAIGSAAPKPGRPPG